MKATREKKIRSLQPASCCSVSWFDQVSADEPSVDEAAPRDGLVENPEYEWTSPANLPGLIAPPDARSSQKPIRRQNSEQAANELFHSEDGDALHPCQLPGRLPTQKATATAPKRLMPSADVSVEIDEYTEWTAMQLPGRLKSDS